jgi:hypothetical protein
VRALRGGPGGAKKKMHRAPAPGHYLRGDKPMAVRLVRFYRSLAMPPGAGRDPDARLPRQLQGRKSPAQQGAEAGE